MSRHRFSKAIVGGALVGALILGSGVGAAGAHHRSDRTPHMPRMSAINEDGSGYNANNGKYFCVVNVGGFVMHDRTQGYYGCTRDPGEGAGPGWAKAYLLWDYSDGAFDGKGGPTLR